MILTILTVLGKICIVSVGFTFTFSCLAVCVVAIKYVINEVLNDGK